MRKEWNTGKRNKEGEGKRGLEKRGKARESVIAVVGKGKES